MKPEHHRRSIRLKGYDYSLPGAYFVTVCTYQRQALFGDVLDGVMKLNEYGNVVEEEWRRTAKLRKNVVLDEFIVMPDHFHGIIGLIDDETCRGTSRRAPTEERFGKPVAGSLPTIVRLLKSSVTMRINQLRKTPQQPVWQRNYYERVLRNNKELDAARKYIFYNPSQWEIDKEHENGNN